MAEGFKSGWEPAWTARLDSIRMTQLQLVTFASIVEGEARADDERETIAGVYHNRLRIGMALQADPTVQYAILLATGRRKTRLFERDYQITSPYNTYLHPGLPPGPVNSPGRRSIEASLYPAKVPYLYFVAGPDGRHIFAKTYAEHSGTSRRSAGASSAVVGRPQPSSVTCSRTARTRAARVRCPPRAIARTRAGRLARIGRPHGWHRSTLLGVAEDAGHDRRRRPRRPDARGARRRAGPRRSPGTASRRPIAPSRAKPSAPSPVPASALVVVTRHGPMPQ